jgi:2,5-diamino-6-(ribosylamino)-4(3H)-pyrimidinone 5'-phosphate reductase
MWASLDARISLGRNRPGKEFASLVFTPAVQDVFRRVRATERPGATLSGSGTILAGAGPLPPPNDRREQGRTPAGTQTEDYLPPHAVDRPDRKGWFVVPDSRGLITWGQVEDEEGQHLLVLAARVTPADYLRHLRERGIPYIVAGEGRIDLEEALKRLSGRLEVTTVLSEGGGKLNGALLRRGLVDEVNVVIVPALVADEHAPTVFDAPPLGPAERPQRLRLLHSEVLVDGGVWLRYAVER